MRASLSVPLIVLFTGFTSLFAEADHDILLRGILKLGSSQAFSMSSTGGTESQWLRLGQSYKGYKLESFDDESEMLTISMDGETFEIGIAAAALTGDEGTFEDRLAEAQRIMTLMNFEKMMDDTMDNQMKAMSDMMRQQMQQMGGAVDEELIKFQGEAMARMFEGIGWEPIEEGMAKAYADVFTKEELEGLSNFYTSPAGQASLEKMPEIQSKTMEVMMPAIMEASQKMQKELMEFMQNRKRQPTD